MKNRVQSLFFLSALVLFLSVGISLTAQQTTPPANGARPTGATAHIGSACTATAIANSSNAEPTPGADARSDHSAVS